MAVNQAAVSDREVEICDRIKELLLELGVGFETTTRPDILVVTEPETNVPITVDSEETVVCLRVLVCPARDHKGFYRRLLEANAGVAHGHFQIEGDQVVLADNLEAANLDGNELEASMASLVTALVRNADWLEEPVDIHDGEGGTGRCRCGHPASGE